MKGFEMTDYLACHFERIARNLSLLCNVIHSNCTTTTNKSLTGHARQRAQERFARELPVRLLKLHMGRFVRPVPH